VAVRKTRKRGEERLPIGRIKIPKKEAEAAVRKSEMITIRVTPADKADMQETARLCRCTLTEYLVSIHRLVAGKL